MTEEREFLSRVLVLIKHFKMAQNKTTKACLWTSFDQRGKTKSLTQQGTQLKTEEKQRKKWKKKHSDQTEQGERCCHRDSEVKSKFPLFSLSRRRRLYVIFDYITFWPCGSQAVA